MMLCFELPELDTELVLDSVRALARYNARTYDCGADELCTRPPWHLRYDKLASSGARVILRDAVTLQRIGSGACGELVAAYAGWLAPRGITSEIVVTKTGEQRWHVTAKVGDVLIDPAQPWTLDAWRRAYGVR